MNKLTKQFDIDPFHIFDIQVKQRKASRRRMPLIKLANGLVLKEPKSI